MVHASPHPLTLPSLSAGMLTVVSAARVSSIPLHLGLGELYERLARLGDGERARMAQESRRLFFERFAPADIMTRAGITELLSSRAPRATRALGHAQARAAGMPDFSTAGIRTRT